METHRRYTKRGLPRRGVDSRYLTCAGKRRYKNVCDAVVAADRLMARNRLGRPIVPYPCPAHSRSGQMIYHIGKEKRLTGNPAQEYYSACASRRRLREEIQVLERVLTSIQPYAGLGLGPSEN
jgi:hypothetical protein